MKLNIMLTTDGYKVDHRRQYPEGTEYVYSNLTPRNGRIEGSTGVVFAGLQAFLDKFMSAFDETFFSRPKSEVVDGYADFITSYLGPNPIGAIHIAALHDLGYVPLEFRAVPEGTFVPYGIPVLTVENTLPEFFWLTNYFETLLSAELWLPITSATTARRYRQILDAWATKTSDTPEFVDWQGHDFSFRGMANAEAAATSGAMHLLYFTGTDTIPAIKFLEEHYDGDGLIGGSVAATEHSVMCADGQDGEQGTFERLLDLYPTGIFSAVSDTFNLWDVLTEYLPALKKKILARDGKFVVRPDSGNPVDILCGDSSMSWPLSDQESAISKGVIELLWDTFGGTVNSKGFKVLDSHVGAIYGDSITTERANAICERLAAKGFASTNVVLGIGSFTYQYVTRDTHGLAMKATWAQVNGVERALFKKPITDDGGKFSARGRLAVSQTSEGLVLVQDLMKEEWEKWPTILQPVWRNGKFVRRTTLAAIRNRVREEL